MTLDEAIERLIANDVLRWNPDKAKEFLEKTVIRIRTEARTKETRRCAARAKETIAASHDEMLGTLVANDLLRTGGLKV